jgi:uncharacterized protein (DUF849 family)
MNLYFESEKYDLVICAKYLITKGLAKPPYVFNILLGGIATAQASLLELGLMVERLPQDSVWLGAGIGSAQLPANVMSLASGGGVRVGLEDNIYLDSGKERLATNLELVERIANISASMGKTIMTSSEFRKQYLS